MLKLALLAGCVLLLGGCAEYFAQRDDATCQSMGAQFGSDNYMQCRLIQQQRRDAFLASLRTPPPRPMLTCYQSGPFTQCQ